MFGGGYFFTLIVMRILQKEIVTRIIVSPPFGLAPFPFWDGLALRSANRFSLVLLVSLLYHRSDAVVYFISRNAGFKSFYVILRSFFAMRLSPFAFGVTKKPDPQVILRVRLGNLLYLADDAWER